MSSSSNNLVLLRCWSRNEWQIGVNDFRHNHLERPLNVRARLGGDFDVVKQIERFEQRPGPRGRDTSLCHQVRLRPAKEDGHVSSMRAAYLDPLLQ